MLVVMLVSSVIFSGTVFLFFRWTKVLNRFTIFPASIFTRTAPISVMSS